MEKNQILFASKQNKTKKNKKAMKQQQKRRNQARLKKI